MNLYSKILRRAGWAVTIVTFLVITLGTAVQNIMDPDHCPAFTTCQTHN